MAIILSRLERLLHAQSSLANDVSLDSPLNSWSDAKKNAVVTLLVKEDASLILEYQTLRALLKQTLSTAEVNEADAIALVQEALAVSVLLDEKYGQYINDRPILRKKNLEAHQRQYKRWLAVHADHQHGHLPSLWAHPELAFADEIRSFTEWVNPTRLTMQRTRKLLLALVKIITSIESYGSWVLWADDYVGPALSYLGLMFFLPRLILNLYTLAIHWFEHESMTDGEASLGSAVRFNAQWERLWPNITNDLAWAFNGMLVCFILTGSLQPLVVYLGIVMQICDLILNGIRAYNELDRFNLLEQQYLEHQQDDPDNHLVADYLLFLHQRIEREHLLIYLSLVNFFVLFIVAGLTLPWIAALSPMVPVIGSAVAVLMTFVNFGGRTYLAPARLEGLDELLECLDPIEPPTPALSVDDEALAIEQTDSFDEVTSVHGPILAINRPLQRSLSSKSSGCLSSESHFHFSSHLRRSHSSSELIESPTSIAISTSAINLRREASANQYKLFGKPPKAAREPSGDFFLRELEPSPHF